MAASFPRPFGFWQRWWPAGLALFCLLVAALALRVSTGLGRARSSPAGSDNALLKSADLWPETPAVLVPTLHLTGVVDAGKLRKALTRLHKCGQTNVSGLLHSLRLFGRDAAFVDPKTGRQCPILRSLLDPETGPAGSHGGTILIETREGVRCRPLRGDELRLTGVPEQDNARETHEHQLLSVLAELGVRADHPLRVRAGVRLVRDMLTDALATFDPAQAEVEWSALAFALYLPPSNAWTDKYGRHRDFDKLAGELMRRPFRAQGCGGTHLLYSLAALYQVDQHHRVLTSAVRGAVRKYLANVVGRLAETQLPCGAWVSRWEARQAPDLGLAGQGAAPDGDLLVTGHHVEWMLLLPTDLLPPRDCFIRAARWLELRLSNTPADELARLYCPYSHAARVLTLMGGVPRNLVKGMACEPSRNRPRPKSIGVGEADHRWERLRNR